MHRSGRCTWPVCLFVLSLINSAGAKPPVDLDEALTAENLKPKGAYYEATVPDTLDLAERARLAVHGLTSFLNPDRNYEHYSYGLFNVNPPYMSNEGDGGANWGKIAEALVMARAMSGSQENLDIQANMLKGMLNNIQPNGNYFVILRGVALDHCYFLIPICSARVMMALMALDQSHPNPKIAQLIGTMADGIYELGKYKDDYAFFSDTPAEAGDTKIGILGYWKVAFIHGSTLRGLARTYALTGDEKILELCRKLKNYITLPKYWVPEAAPKAVVGAEHAQFMGHHHSYTAALMGLLWYAQVAHDTRMMQFVRDGYEYLRNFGIARIGLFGEMCTTGDMTYLAVKLSDLGVGDYWEDVDQYVRNQLTEQQITDPERLRAVVETMPEQEKLEYPFDQTQDRVIERNVGAYLSDASNPVLVRPQTLRWTICCSGNCTPALYGTWEAIVREQDGTAQINLLLNRASPWLDIDSYLPYEGKVVIRNKTAKKLSVRLPRWVDRESVSSSINGLAASPYWVGRHLVFNQLAEKDIVKIEFPIVETTETYTVTWRVEDFWPESTNPGHDWQPPDPPNQYTIHLRGNTLVDISPRSDAPGYPLYLRDHFQAAKTPMKTVTRFIQSNIVKW